MCYHDFQKKIGVSFNATTTTTTTTTINLSYLYIQVRQLTFSYGRYEFRNDLY